MVGLYYHHTKRERFVSELKCVCRLPKTGMGLHDNPTASGSTFGEAYRRAVNRYQDGAKSLTVSCWGIDDAAPPGTLDIRDWEDILDMGDEWELIRDIETGREDGKTHGTTIEDWVNNRILELHRDRYWQRAGDQIEQITDRLKDGLHGSSTNSLVAQLFEQDDLDQACISRPNVQELPCVTQLQFHPVKDELHLHMTIRSQYLDLKGLGNLVSGGTLLTTVAHEAGYSPGTVYEHVHNATVYRTELMNKIHRHFDAYEQRPVLRK